MLCVSIDVKASHRDDHQITAEIFTTDAIRTELHLSQADYFLIAVLSGGDYNKVTAHFYKYF
jgi:hypothetical protein